MDFVHLHVHTEYSLLDGSNKIREYVSRVKELGMHSAAITDHGAMYGVIDFYRAAREAGIKPILGCEIYVAPGSRFDRENIRGEDRYYHLVLLARDQEGYENLMRIVSIGFVEGFYYKPRVDKETLRKYSQGLIALSACVAGEVQRYILRGMDQEAKAAALEYQEIFGVGNFYLELQDHGLESQKLVNQKLLLMSKELGIELVATNDVHYTRREDEVAHDILLCIQTKKKVVDEDRMRYEGGQYFVKSPEEMEALFPYALQALENTAKIAERCNVEIAFGVTKLPQYPVPEGQTAWDYLNTLSRQGLKKRYPDSWKRQEAKLEYELGVIREMGYVDYFLIVWDFIHYAKNHGIMVGPGRGSAAGSLVSYCLEITDVDPLKYQLLFERFLNPERVSMPDIDIDFCFERRQEVIDYVEEKYGKERVVQIVTFGTMAARGVIRDVGRALDVPYSFRDSLAKMIPNVQGRTITIDDALEMNPEFRKLYQENGQVRDLIDMSRKLEGLPRHTSVHAAGVVIGRTNIMEYVPLARASDGSAITQFTMTTLEELGLLKMDFLGLRTLTVIRDCVGLVKDSTGVQLDMDAIDYNDKDVLGMIGTGKTDGVFQLESPGMSGFMKELKPESLEDVIAGIALYRPGPMDFIPDYLRGKNGNVVYDCPQLKPILSSTYGCIVYQEQVMQIVRDLAGYTMGRSDLVRRAMSKKKEKVMQEERRNFVYGNQEENVPGCVNNGISEQVANKIFDKMLDFAQYAFNKSHAAAYSIVTYQTAWLKYYYPVEYMAALMTSVISHPTKVAGYIFSCRKMNIEILPPDVNEGQRNFTVSEGSIRYALSAIKSIGAAVIDNIVSEREKNGKFATIKDFISRMAPQDINRKVIENFIKSGTMDSLPGNRRQQLEVYPLIFDSVNKEKKTAMTGQMSLFDLVGEEEKAAYEVRLPDVEEYPEDMILAMEKEVLGMYVSGHPLAAYEELMRSRVSALTSEFMLDEETGEVQVRDGQSVAIGGIVTGKTMKYTKRNEVMAFIKVEDLVGEVEVIVFPDCYEKYSELLQEDRKLFLWGKVSVKEDRAAQLICQRILPMEQGAARADTDAFSASGSAIMKQEPGQEKKARRELWIKYDTKEQYLQGEEQLSRILQDARGKDPVVIYVKEPQAVKRLPAGSGVQADDDLVGRLRALFGEGNVLVVAK